jgi:hypothetical protein
MRAVERPPRMTNAACVTLTGRMFTLPPLPSGLIFFRGFAPFVVCGASAPK